MPNMSVHEGGGSFPGGPGGMVSPGLFGSTSVFGDGAYSGNVIQGGSVLQPQASYSALIPWNGSYGINTYSASFAGYIIIDRAAAVLAPGVRVSGFRLYSLQAGNQVAFGVARRDSAGNWTPVARTADITTTAAGYQFATLAADYVVPNDGKEYRVFQYTLPGFGSYHSAASTYARAAVLANPVVGTQIAGVTEGTGIVTGVDYTTVFKDAVVITGAATVTPDATTGASSVMCNTVVADGASASLTSSTNSKGLFIIAKTGIHEVNGGKIHMDGKGKAGNFGDLTVYSLLSAAIQKKLKRSMWEGFVLKGEGAAGAPATVGNNVSGLTGAAGTTMQTGGGGSGASVATTHPGGKGGPTCGGAGSAGAYTNAGTAPGPYGGPGGNAFADGGASGGGAGDPVGTGDPSGLPGNGPGGGVLGLAAPVVSLTSGCVASADGSRGGAGYRPGGGAGGGNVFTVTYQDGLINSGTIRAAGGLGGAAQYGPIGGSGGAGSVTNIKVNMSGGIL